MLAKAIALVSQKFENVKDKSGQPYILHCLRVMNNVDQNDHELMQIAVMHDLMEDCEDIKPIHLSDMGFSDRVVESLKFLTHNKEKSTYDEYIKLLSFNQDAVKVKIADLIDNSNITRLKGLRKKDFERMEKYHKAFIYLKNN